MTAIVISRRAAKPFFLGREAVDATLDGGMSKKDATQRLRKTVTRGARSAVQLFWCRTVPGSHQFERSYGEMVPLKKTAAADCSCYVGLMDATEEEG